MRVLSRLPLFLALAALLGLLVLFALRSSYPFELEWQEGGVLDHVLRVRAGEALYVQPDLEFAPFPYTPLFYWLSALLPGAGFLPLRLVSILATVVAALCIARLAYLESGKVQAGVLGAGLFAAAYAFCGAWYDVARVDSLALAFSLAGLWAARSGGAGRVILAGLFAGLAILSKQSAALPALFLLLPLARRRRALILPYLGALLLPAGLVCAWLESSSEGAFSATTFGLLSGHLRAGQMLFEPWLELPLWSAPLMLLSAACFMRSTERGGDRSFLASYLFAALILSLVARTHEGGYRNAHMPVIAALAVCGAVGVERLRARGAGVGLWASLAAAAQLALFACYQNPVELVPTSADREAGEHLIADLQRLEGELFLPSQGYLARAAGKSSCIHSMAIIDLLKAGAADPDAAHFMARLMEALEQRRYGAILLRDVDRPAWEGELAPFSVGYRRERALFPADQPSLFMPVSGASNRPDWLYLRRH